jgi:hypothetical protein
MGRRAMHVDSHTRARLALAFLVTAVLANACGSNFETEEAQAECNRIRAAQAQCFTAAVYDQCVACFEECGRECSQVPGATCGFTCD